MTSVCRSSCLVAAAWLAVACGSSHQAPISDQGRPRVVYPPEIFSSGSSAQRSDAPAPVSSRAGSGNASGPSDRGGRLRASAAPAVTAASGEGRSAASRPGQASSRLAEGVRWQWPHRGDVVQGYQVASSRGIDIAGSLGDPVLAAGAGEVEYSGRGIQGRGYLIIIRHNDRLLSAYSHNRSLLVQVGASVQAGQQIAELGSNDAGEAVLHFEIRRNGAAVDPAQLLPTR